MRSAADEPTPPLPGPEAIGSPETTPGTDSAPGPDAGAFLGFSAPSWRRAGKEFGWVIAAQAAAAVAGLVSVRLLTECAPQGVFGEGSLLLGALVLGRSVFLGPVANAQSRFHPVYQQRGQPEWFTARMARLSRRGIGLITVSGAVAYVAWRLATASTFRPFVLVLLLGILWTDLLRSVRATRLNAERRQARLSLWTVTDAWFIPLATVLFLLLSPSTEAFLLGQAVGAGFSVGLCGYLLWPTSRPDPVPPGHEAGRELDSWIRAYALPFVALAVLGWAASQGERYVVGGCLGADAAGIYVASYSLASRPFLVASGGITLAVRPVLFEAEAAGNRSKARRVFALWVGSTAVIGAVGTGLFWLVGPWLARIFLAPAYREGAPQLFIIVAAAHALFGVTQVIENYLLGLGRSGRLLGPSLVGAATTLALAALLVPRRGPLGAAEAKGVGFAVQLACASLAVVGARRATGKMEGAFRTPEP